MPHIFFLGDSVFDNAAYVASGQALIDKLTDRLPAGWRVTMNARDGAVIADVSRQVEQSPADATHLIVSVGGNDALRQVGLLDEPAASVGEALALLATVRETFQHDYRTMLDRVLQAGLPTVICTIYDPRFPDPDRRRTASAGLAILNDVITREAAARGTPLIDLRVIFNEDADFANAIEPSARGGEKLAWAVIQVVEEHDFTRPHASVFRGTAPG